MTNYCVLSKTAFGECTTYGPFDCGRARSIIASFVVRKKHAWACNGIKDMSILHTPDTVIISDENGDVTRTLTVQPMFAPKDLPL